MTNRANASHINVSHATDALYTCVNSHAINKMESELFTVVENDMTLCPNEREVQF